jgi:DNA-binding HxlR family transcriptional regulator
MNSRQSNRCKTGCPAEATLAVMNGTWKVPILFHLAKQTKRFSELRRELADISPKVLAHQLREMERDGIVARKVYAQVPPKVEYSLTSAGRSLMPVVKVMCQWGSARMRK